MSTRVCVVDNVVVFRAAVRRVLEVEGDFEVIEAGTLDELETVLQDEGLDVVIVDANLPPAGGVAVIRACAGRCPNVIVWSMEVQPLQVLEAVQAGATGYLRKEISPPGLVRALRGAVHGESALSRDLVAMLIQGFHENEKRSRIEQLAASLSARECEVLEHLALGERNKQIAAALGISEFTVKRHVQNILEKLGLPSRHAAARLYGSLAYRPKSVA
jgi:DNA-binding NarL/FixJ family response regulator